MGSYDDRPYEVGKGKPPRKYRWSKGQSGNPRGPRRKRNEANETSQEILAEIANLPIPVVDKLGRSKTVPMKKALLLELAKDGLQGSPAQRRQAIVLLNEHGFFDLKPAPSQQTMKEREQAREQVLDMLARFAEEEEKADLLTRPRRY